jgi:hypothetical protein
MRASPFSIDLGDSLENSINLKLIHCYRIPLTELSSKLKIKGNYEYV